MGGLFSFFDNKLPLSTNNQNQNAQNITNKVLEMAARNLQQVELELNPQNLGKMKIKIDINDAKNASVSFMVNNATTKELLSGSFDKLKAALEDVGYQLTEQNVTQHNAEDTGTNSNREFNNSEWRKEVLATSKSMHNSKEWMNAFTQEMKI
jgi:flagellar hook-length control protein FliK